MKTRTTNLIIRVFLKLLFILGLAACGVKGDPIPPETPAEIGAGKRAYQIPPGSKPSSVVPGSPDEEENDDKQEEQ